MINLDHMYKMRLIRCHALCHTCIILLTGILSTVVAQDDSAGLEFDRLKWDDIKSTAVEKRNDVVISGSRTERRIEDLPFTIYVITAEQIKDNGYLTLTDALKSLPGIRVSQPGSAIEGETFLMRGLLGNSYAKILINDIPISPFVVSGFPIASQLPLSQAERIEVIYGPTATLYGADASAGIINIILKDSEYPIYTQADFDLGENGLYNLDASVGGKFGQGRKIVKYRFIGKFLTLNDWEVRYALDSNYNPIRYGTRLGLNPDFDVNYLDQPNYAGLPESPFLGNYPHRSGLLGIDLSLGNIKFNAYRMFRSDHSALGLNPFAVSHARPYNSFGENISVVSLQFEKKFPKWSFRLNPRYLGYTTNSDNNTAYVLPFLGVLMQQFEEELETSQDPAELEKSRTQIIDTYFDNDRFNSASSDQASMEGFFNFTLNDKVDLASGFSFTTGIGSPLKNFSNTSSGILFISQTDPVKVQDVDFTEISAFTEVYLNLNRFNMIVGGQILKRYSDFLSNEDPIFNPRIAAQYKLNPKISFRSSYSEAFRYPSPYFDSNSFQVNLNAPESISTGSSNLNPEKTRSIDVGLRLKPHKNIQADASVFYTKTNDFISYNINFDNEFDLSRFDLGYLNDEKSFAEISGVQLSISTDNLISSIALGGELNFNYNKGKERITAISPDLTPILSDIDGVRALPKVISQLRLHFKPLSNFKVIIDNTFISKSLVRNVFAFFDQDAFFEINNEHQGYYTMDVSTVININDRTTASIKMKNFFNTQYAGIDATSDLDALFYNPQPLRTFRFGIKYRLN